MQFMWWIRTFWKDLDIRFVFMFCLSNSAIEIIMMFYQKPWSEPTHIKSQHFNWTPKDSLAPLHYRGVWLAELLDKLIKNVHDCVSSSMLGVCLNASHLIRNACLFVLSSVLFIWNPRLWVCNTTDCDLLITAFDLRAWGVFRWLECSEHHR